MLFRSTQELLAELKSLREQLQKKSASTDAEFELQKRYISLLERNCLLEDNSVREEFFWIHEYFMHDYYTLMGKLHGDRFAGE